METNHTRTGVVGGEPAEAPTLPPVAGENAPTEEPALPPASYEQLYEGLRHLHV